MSTISDHVQEASFRNTRPLSNGRMLVRWGKYFYILETAELREIQRWRSLYLAIQLGTSIVIMLAMVLWITRFDAAFSAGVFYVAVLISAFVMFVDNWRIWRLKRQRQPDDRYDDLAEAWDRAGSSGLNM